MRRLERSMVPLLDLSVTCRPRSPAASAKSMMCIVVIQGPHLRLSSDADFSPSEGQAKAAGKQLLVHTATTLQQLIECICKARAADTEIVLLDSGELDTIESVPDCVALCDTLDALASPYIKMHDSSRQMLDLNVHPQHGPLVSVVVNDDRAGSYALALAIALRRLGSRAAPPHAIPA